MLVKEDYFGSYFHIIRVDLSSKYLIINAS